MPDEAEVRGLLALLLLTDARRAARTAADGAIVLLPDQDRALVGPGADRGGPRPRARVPAAQPAGSVPDPGGHQRGARRRGDRRRDRLARRSSPSTTSCCVYAPTPVVELNRAVALAEAGGRGRRARGHRGPRPRRLPPVPRRPGRPAAPARPRPRTRRRPTTPPSRLTGNAAERRLLESKRDAVG